jgi:signal transduction histidine kinase
MSKLSLNAGRLSGNKEVQTVATLAASIAHEIKNYLSAINICSELSGMQLENIRKKVKAADYVINNLQLQIKGLVTGKTDTKNFRRYSIAKNIKEALEGYPFKAGELDLITLDIAEDFEYNGDPALTAHLLYNFIRNALRAVSIAGKGKVTIKLKPGLRVNKLVFRDTATGIPKKVLPKIFSLFETQMKEQGGTGVGLAFTKTIMQGYGGDISCDSVVGGYTEFVLSFPSIQK